MDLSFSKALFKSSTPMMLGSLCAPLAATKIVIWYNTTQMQEGMNQNFPYCMDSNSPIQA